MSQEVSSKMVSDVAGSGANAATQWGNKLRLSEADAAHSYVLLCTKKTPAHSQLRQREKDQ